MRYLDYWLSRGSAYETRRVPVLKYQEGQESKKAGRTNKINPLLRAVTKSGFKKISWRQELQKKHARQ